MTVDEALALADEVANPRPGVRVAANSLELVALALAAEVRHLRMATDRIARAVGCDPGNVPHAVDEVLRLLR